MFEIKVENYIFLRKINIYDINFKPFQFVKIIKKLNIVSCLQLNNYD